MSKFTYFVLCFQACLIQIAFSQFYANNGLGLSMNNGYPGAIGNGVGLAGGIGVGYGINSAGYNSGMNGVVGTGIVNNCGPYGAMGQGELAVSGELPVGGATTVAGQVPVIGAVQFNGQLPASGLVSLAGSCGCDCHNVYY